MNSYCAGETGQTCKVDDIYQKVLSGTLKKTNKTIKKEFQCKTTGAPGKASTVCQSCAQSSERTLAVDQPSSIS